MHPLHRYSAKMIAVWLGVLLLAAAPAGAADGPAEAAGERMVFRIAYGNVPLAEATLWLRQHGSRYEVSGEGGTSGPLEWLFDWKGRVRTEGRLDRGGLFPELHDQHGIWRGETRQAQVRYGADRSIVHVVEPPLDPLEFTPVPEGSIAGTMDPLTAALSALKHFAATGRCHGTLPIFDGRRRYDMLLEDAGTALLIRDRPWNYGGRAHGCRLKSHRIGGFFKRDEDEPSDDAPQSERLVWLAELAPGSWRPVRFEVDAPLGKFIGRAVLADE